MVLLTLFLITQWGLLGVAVGTCIPMVISKGFVQPWLLARLHNLSYFYVWRNLLLEPLLWGIGVFVIFFTRADFTFEDEICKELWVNLIDNERNPFSFR